jgi:hypothetical protein
MSPGPPSLTRSRHTSRRAHACPSAGQPVCDTTALFQALAAAGGMRRSGSADAYPFLNRRIESIQDYDLRPCTRGRERQGTAERGLSKARSSDQVKPRAACPSPKGYVFLHVEAAPVEPSRAPFFSRAQERRCQTRSEQYLPHSSISSACLANRSRRIEAALSSALLPRASAISTR